MGFVSLINREFLRVNKWKFYTLFLIIALVSLSFVTIAIAAYTSPDIYISSPSIEADYVVQTDGLGWYRCINGSTGQVLQSSVDSSSVLSNAFGNATSKDVLIESGTYYGSSLNMPSNMTLYSNSKAKIIYNGVSATGVLLTTSTTQQNQFMTVRGLKFDGNGQNCTLMNWTNTKNCWIEDNEFYNTGGSMIKLVSHGAYESFYNRISGNHFEIGNGIYQKTDYSVATVWSQGDNIITNNIFDNWPNQYNMFVGIYTINAGDIITGNHITHCQVGIRAAGGSMISSNYLDTCTVNAISVSGKTGIMIVGNFIYHNSAETYYYAIDVGATSTRINISLNVFTAQASTDYYIELGASTTNCTVAYNSFSLTNLGSSTVHNSGTSNVVIPAAT